MEDPPQSTSRCSVYTHLFTKPLSTNTFSCQGQGSDEKMRDGDMGQTRTCSHAQRMAQSQGWVKRYFKAFCKGFFVAVPVAVTFLDQVACVARVEGASMQPSLNPDGSRSSDVVLLNHWEVRNFKVHRGDIVSLVHQLCLESESPLPSIVCSVFRLKNLPESTFSA
ncbi:mitochondrial inner membrane protease subunit 2 isoform X4 [Molossus molossus]|uniref:mitochondrial inner membrane protease subunit 2 isoform X4 n=1 Tax=Molossus molossus TaxID=27622 RepID=UPI001745D2C7|nr:mitochondrial inner membrane protease subunit 2 isoform X4 [Molossus molossus]